MGYAREKIENALNSSKGNVNEALEDLIQEIFLYQIIIDRINLIKLV